MIIIKLNIMNLKFLADGNKNKPMQSIRDDHDKQTSKRRLTIFKTTVNLSYLGIVEISLIFGTIKHLG